MDKQREAEITTAEAPAAAQRSASPKISPRAQTPPVVQAGPTSQPAAVMGNTAPLVVNTANAASSAAASPRSAVAAPSPRTPLRTSHSAGAIPSSSRKATGGHSSPAMTEASRVSSRGANETTGHSVLVEVLGTRKRTEADMEMIANRLQLLRMEEERARQKVMETQERAEEIKLLKKRNEDAHRARQEAALARQMEEKQIRDKVQKEKEMRRRKVEMTRKIIEDSRKEEALRLKQATKQQMNQTMIDNLRKMEMNKKKALMEKKKREDRRRAKEEAVEERLAESNRRRQELIEAERRRAEEAEAAIRQMEEEEAKLIRSLKKTQKMQEKAYAALQQSLEA